MLQITCLFLACLVSVAYQHTNCESAAAEICAALQYVTEDCKDDVCPLVQALLTRHHA